MTVVTVVKVVRFVTVVRVVTVLTAVTEVTVVTKQHRFDSSDKKNAVTKFNVNFLPETYIP